MRKIVQSYMLFVFVVLMGISCHNKKQERIEVKTINIEEFQNNMINIYDVVKNIKIIPIETDSTVLIGNVKDICFFGEYIYLLDDLTASILKIDMKDGSCVKKICDKGNGPNEYIRPAAIKSDSSWIYLLDMPMRQLIFYNHELEAQKTIRLPVSAQDFECVNNGFLLYNADSSPKANKLVYIDRKGNVKNNFFPCTEFNNSGIYNWGRERNFSINNNQILFSEPYSNTIYIWKNNHPTLKYQLSFGNLTTPNPTNINNYNIFEDFSYAVCMDFFNPDDFLIISFIYKNQRYYCFSNLLTDEKKMGVVSDEKNDFPFFPRWQNGNTLIGFVYYKDIKSIINIKDMIVTKNSNFTTSDDYMPFLVFFTI